MSGWRWRRRGRGEEKEIRKGGREGGGVVGKEDMESGWKRRWREGGNGDEEEGRT